MHLLRDAGERTAPSPHGMNSAQARTTKAAHLTGRLFLLCRIDEAADSRATDELRSLQLGSTHRIDVFNFFGWPGPLTLDPSWDWVDCDGIILHDSLAGDFDAFDEVAGYMPASLAGFQGVKILLRRGIGGEQIDVLSFAKENGFRIVTEPWTADALDNLVAQSEAEKGNRARILPCGATTSVHVLQLCAHAPHKDPRIGWVAAFAPEGMIVHTLGCSNQPDDPLAESVEITEGGRLVVTENLACFDGKAAGWEVLADEETGPAAALWCRLDAIGRLRQPRSGSVCGPSAADVRDVDFSSLCRHFAVCGAALLHAAVRFERIDALVASDPDSLLPACILKRMWKVPLIYDSHEFWSESFPRFSTWEREFWRGVERQLIAECDAVFTVSRPLASHMSEVFGVPFGSVPNCEPLTGSGDAEPAVVKDSGDRTIFLFMGNYAEERGLEKLVKLWPHTPENAILHFRGHRAGIYPELASLARESGLLDRRIFFLDPVKEEEMVRAAREAHVGLIPYEAIGPNNTFCCPNKLSQYCTAGLAILANKLVFVEECIYEAGNGLAADINDAGQFVEAVARLSGDREALFVMQRNSLRFHRQVFNWQQAGKPLYSSLQRLTSDSSREGPARAAFFRTIMMMPAFGGWGLLADGTVAPRKPSRVEELCAHVATLNDWLERRRQQIEKLQSERKSLKDKLRKREKKIAELSRRRGLLTKLLDRLLGKRDAPGSAPAQDKTE